MSFSLFSTTANSGRAVIFWLPLSISLDELWRDNDAEADRLEDLNFANAEAYETGKAPSLLWAVTEADTDDASFPDLVDAHTFVNPVLVA